MTNPNIKTKVVHSESKDARNIVANRLSMKYKIARIPYDLIGDKRYDIKSSAEALEHAEFISYCFNHSDKICEIFK